MRVVCPVVVGLFGVVVTIGVVSLVDCLSLLPVKSLSMESFSSRYGAANWPSRGFREIVVNIGCLQVGVDVLSLTLSAVGVVFV